MMLKPVSGKTDTCQPGGDQKSRNSPLHDGGWLSLTPWRAQTGFKMATGALILLLIILRLERGGPLCKRTSGPLIAFWGISGLVFWTRRLFIGPIADDSPDAVSAYGGDLLDALKNYRIYVLNFVVVAIARV